MMSPSQWFTFLFLELACCISFAYEASAEEFELRLGPAEPLPSQLYTFNTDMATAIMFRGLSYDSPQFENAVRQLKPQALRFPGGTLANNYLWKEDSFSAPTNDKTGWAAEQLNWFRKIGRPYDVAGFARVVKRNNISPIWVLNVYEETPQSVLALFDKFDSLGMKINALEMGNEPYWDGRSLADVQAYISACRPIAEALHKQRPEVSIGACFAPFGNPANYEVIWNTPLAQEDWIDANVFHEYYGGQGFILEAGQKISIEAMLYPEAMIDEPIKIFRKLMPGKPIWFTEWNIGAEGLNQWKNKGAELQYIAAMFTSLVEHRDSIDIACFHAFYDSRFGAFYIDDATGSVATNASYELFRLLGTVFDEAATLRPIEFTTQYLRGFATQRDDELQLFLLNRGAKELDISLTELQKDHIKKQLLQLTIDCQPDRKLPITASLANETIISGSSITLPAYSISLIGSRERLKQKLPPIPNDNLFPRRPDLLFWYPPYASEQPRFDTDGVYAIDLAKCADKEMAVLKMDLASSKLQQDQLYTIQFEARANDDGGLIVKLPQKNQSEGLYSLLSRDFSPLRYSFKFDAAANAGQVTFVFLEDMISKHINIEFRNFEISLTD